MKQFALGLAAMLIVGVAQAQTAPVQAPAAPAAQTQPQNGNADGTADQANAETTTVLGADGKPVPTVAQKSVKGNHTTLILGAVGAAALLAGASHSGDSDKPLPPKTPAASSP